MKTIVSAFVALSVLAAIAPLPAPSMRRASMRSWIERRTDGRKSERGGVGRRALSATDAGNFTAHRW